MAQLHSIRGAIPLVPVNMRDPEKQYEFKEFPKMMLQPDGKPYSDRHLLPVVVNNADEEAAFRKDHPEARKTLKVNPTDLRNEALEDENSKLRELLLANGVKMPAEAAEVEAKDDGASLAAGVVRQDDELPAPMSNVPKGATVKAKAKSK